VSPSPPSAIQPHYWERLSELFELTESGIPTAWVPRSAVIAELVAADADDRAAVIADHRSDILTDCITVLKEVSSPDLGEYVDLLDEALTAATSGQIRAAQALAASVFDTFLRDRFQPRKLSGYYDRLKKEIKHLYDNAPMSTMRWGVVHVPVLVVLGLFDPTKGDPIPTNFNRHASAHAVGRVQYTPANAVIALALVTSMLREAQEELTDLSSSDAGD